MPINEYGETYDDGNESWGSLSGSGNSDPSWDSDVTGGSSTDSSGFDFFDNTDGFSNTAEPDWSGYGDLTTAELGKLGTITDSNSLNAIANLAKSKLGKGAGAFLKKYLFNPDTGEVNPAGLTAAAMSLYGMMNQDKQGGYNKPVPLMEAVREQIQYTDPNRRPGEAGRQYFTDTRFVPKGDAAAAKTASADQAAGIRAAYQPRAAEEVNPYAGKMKMAYNPPDASTASNSTQTATLPQIPTQLTAQGGIPMAEGGLASAGRYLQGETDGMADEIPSSIDGKQDAALSHGEFVIPADVVSHLGNGNSDAGAKKLYEMMDRIRQARTGTKEQGKEINPDEFTMGGLAAAYAGGGSVKGFDGTTGSVVNATGGNGSTAPTGGAGVPNDVSRTSTLSPWVGDYVTNALGQGAALAAQPYQAYTGPLTAGASGLQQQAFAGASEMAQAGYTPGQFTGGFDASKATQYMNPYLQASLDPQLKELQRQADIQRVADAGRMTRAGAFGGSRQAIMESEGRRNLLDKQAGLLGTGYKTAYDTGLGQFNKEREADESSRQFGANFGLKAVDQLADLGAQQRGITAEGVAADKAQFEEQRDFAYGMPKYQLGLLSGLPIGANTTSVDQDALGKLTSRLSALGANYQLLDKALKDLGQAPKTPG